jgi:hypothetical protein
VTFIHFGEFAKSVGEPRPGEERSPGSLFAMLGLDPFTQLNPAVREVAETRELAERTIFYMQRAPSLIDMQLERFMYQLAIMPETKSLLRDIGRASLVGTAADRFVESLPDLVAKEREAVVSQLMQELNDRRGTISSLSGELRSTLEAGTETVNSLHSTLETFDRIVARYPPNERPSSTFEDSQPFDITEITKMVREFTVATRELNALAQQVDTALPTISSVTQEVAGRVERIQSYLFMQLLAIVVVTVSAILVAAITYRVAVIRFNHPKVQP